MKPELSVVLPTDAPDTIEPVLEKLRAQDIARRLELVLVTTHPERLVGALTGETAFAKVRVVGVPSLSPLGEARAAGIGAASSPWVFLGETHSYPVPGWAGALVAVASSGPWSVIACGMENANPGSVFSWAGFLADYARWASVLPAGEVSEAPIYNAAYRREALHEIDAPLTELFSHGDQLRLALEARGNRVWFEPTARLAHANIDQPATCLRERFLAGSLIGSQRARLWPWWRRLVYAGGSFLIPVVLMRRLLPGVRQMARVQTLPRGTFPLIVLLTCVKSAGEFLGYLGLGRAAHQAEMDNLEVFKLDHLAGPVP